MTRKNAIKQLKMLKEHLKNDMYADDVNALNTAIQALESLDKIKAEIEKPLREERFLDTENAKAQAIALSWCLEVINKHIGEQNEDSYRDSMYGIDKDGNSRKSDIVIHEL